MSWDLVTLGMCVSFCGGGTPSKKVKEYWNGSIPWATVKDLKSNTLSTTQDTITEAGLKGSASKLIAAGNIIIATRMALGKAAINTIDLAINQDLKALFCYKNIDTNYLLHFLKFKSQHIEDMGKGATVKGITLKVLEEIQIPLPPLPEQKRIAAILDKADAIRRKRKQALDMADEFLRATFLDMFGDPVTNPMGWDVKELGELLTGNLKNGLSPSSTGTVSGNVYTLSSITGPIFNISAQKAGLFDKNIAPYYPKENLFLICRGNGNKNLVGKGKFPTGDFKGTIYPDTIISAPINTKIIQPEILETQWETFFIRDQIERGARTTNGTFKINQTVINNIKVIVPKLEEQLDFCQRIKKLKEIVHKVSVNDADSLFASLSQKAFKGEL